MCVLFIIIRFHCVYHVSSSFCRAKNFTNRYLEQYITIFANAELPGYLYCLHIECIDMLEVQSTKFLQE